jgi:glycine/D-amino acid oxidase-like deaminating enzyme
VAVVGGGLAGCTTAFVFAQAGVPTVLLEAGRLAAQGTGGAPGVMDAGAGARFDDLRERHGLRVARHLWDTSRRAVLDLQTLIRRLRIRCDLERTPAVDVALSDHEATRLEREYRALCEAGIEASWITGKRVRSATGLDAAAILKRSDAGRADPYRLALALAAHAERRGAAVHEGTTAIRVRVRRTGVEITTDAGEVTAGTVVVATDKPAPDLRALHRHVRPVATTAAFIPALPAAVRNSLPAATSVTRDGADPRRAWAVSRRGDLLVWQSGQAELAPRQRETASRQRTNELMYEFSVMYPAISGIQPAQGWTVTGHRSQDGLVVAGPHRAFPRHLFAVGMGIDGLQAAWLAARVNLRHYRGAPDKGDELFGFLR